MITLRSPCCLLMLTFSFFVLVLSLSCCCCRWLVLVQSGPAVSGHSETPRHDPQWLYVINYFPTGSGDTYGTSTVLRRYAATVSPVRRISPCSTYLTSWCRMFPCLTLGPLLAVHDACRRTTTSLTELSLYVRIRTTGIAVLHSVCGVRAISSPLLSSAVGVH